MAESVNFQSHEGQGEHSGQEKDTWVWSTCLHLTSTQPWASHPHATVSVSLVCRMGKLDWIPEASIAEDMTGCGQALWCGPACGEGFRKEWVSY